MKVPTSGPSTPENKTKKPSQMEIDPNPTKTLTLIHFTYDTSHSTSLSPIGFTSDNSDEEDNNTWQEIKHISSSNKGKEKQTKHIHPNYLSTGKQNMADTDIKCLLKLKQIPGQNINQKINLLTKFLHVLNLSFPSAQLSNKIHQIITAIFGSISDANKAKNITLDDNTTIHMQEAPVYDGITAKNKTIGHGTFPLMFHLMKYAQSLPNMVKLSHSKCKQLACGNQPT